MRFMGNPRIIQRARGRVTQRCAAQQGVRSCSLGTTGKPLKKVTPLNAFVYLTVMTYFGNTVILSFDSESGDL